MLVRLREAVKEVGLLNTKSWQCPDDVEAKSLPLARATEKTLASMHAVLQLTLEARETELREIDESGKEQRDEKLLHLHQTRASEVRVVKGAQYLQDPSKFLIDGKHVSFQAIGL